MNYMPLFQCQNGKKRTRPLSAIYELLLVQTVLPPEALEALNHQTIGDIVSKQTVCCYVGKVKH